MTRYPLSAAANAPDRLMPWLPMTLGYGNRSIEVAGLVDSGSAINVLPYDYGLALGMVWEEHRVELVLAGALAKDEARACFILAGNAALTGSSTVELAMAWSSSNDPPVIFGRTNFFTLFNVCIYASRQEFEVWRA